MPKSPSLLLSHVSLKLFETAKVKANPTNNIERTKKGM
jgi:hypothetical protein